MSYERMVKKESELAQEIRALREQVDAVLADAQRVDAQQDEAFGAEPRRRAARTAAAPRDAP